MDRSPKVLGLAGSPRRGGNTEIMLDVFLEAASDKGAAVRKIVLNELSFLPCQGCGACDDTGVCVLKDGFNPVYRAITEADVLVLATPVYFGAVSAQLKAAIDRCQCLWAAHMRMKGRASRKKGYLLAAQHNSAGKYFYAIRLSVRAFFASLGITYAGGILAAQVERCGDVRKRKGVLARVSRMGGLSCRLNLRRAHD